MCDGIKVQNLDTVKIGILSNESLCVDFAKCVTLFFDFNKQKQATEGPPTCTIAQVHMKPGNGGSLVKFKVCYYSHKEYFTLLVKRRLSFMANDKNVAICLEISPARKANLAAMTLPRALR